MRIKDMMTPEKFPLLYILTTSTHYVYKKHIGTRKEYLYSNNVLACACAFVMFAFT